MMDKDLENRIIEKIKTVYDPEIPVDVYELGLIYDITSKSDTSVHVLMTLTSPSCPEAEVIPGKIELAIKELKEITEVEMEITFEPPWEKDMMSEEAQLELGLI